MKQELVTTGALLKCSQGVLPTPFMTTSNVLFTVAHLPVGTVLDMAPLVNIVPFGICQQLTKLASGVPTPCVPAPTGWQQPGPRFAVQKNAVLTKASCTRCAIGGQIEFLTSGQLPSIAYIGNDPMVTKGWQEASQSTKKRAWTSWGGKARKELRQENLYLTDGRVHAHHKVPVQLLKKNPIVQSAVRQGFNFNGRSNGEGLDVLTHLNVIEKEYHHNEYNRIVDDYIKREFADSGMTERDFLEEQVIPLIDRFIAEAKRTKKTLNDLAKSKNQLRF